MPTVWPHGCTGKATNLDPVPEIPPLLAFAYALSHSCFGSRNTKKGYRRPKSAETGYFMSPTGRLRLGPVQLARSWRTGNPIDLWPFRYSA